MTQTAIDTDVLNQAGVVRGRPGTSRVPAIQQAWQAGLSVLKPSLAQLEHGLELHRHAVSLDTFGFLPMATNLRLRQKWHDLIDAGVTGRAFSFRSSMQRRVAPTFDDESGQVLLEALYCSGLSGMIHTAAEGKCLAEDVKRIATSVHTCGWFSPQVEQFRRVSDVFRAHQQDRFAVGLSVNGPPVTGELADLDDELQWLDAWYQFGVRLMHLTYNRQNVIGTGCAERHDAGLSELGYDLLAALNRVGIVADVSHSSENTAQHAAAATTRPIVASHTGCKAVYDHIRTKSDQTLKAIAQTDGLVGIVGLGRFLGPNGDIHALLNHVDHAVRLIGANHVAIGSDSCYSPSHPDDWARPPKSHFSSRWWGAWHRAKEWKPAHADPAPCPSLTWTNWPLFTVGLVTRGHSDEDIQKILGLNLLRVLRAHEV